MPRESRDRTAGCRTVAGEPARMFDYDEASRLTGYDDVTFGAPQCSWDEVHGFQCTPSSVDTVGTATYTYDRVGNRTDSGAQVATGNRLTAFDGWTLEWDAAGQLTRQYNGTTDRRFYWNALGQLDSASVDGVVTRFTYDGFGRRIEKQGPAGTVEQVYDGDDPFWALDGSGAVQAEYSFYPGVDRPHSVERGGTAYYYGQDELGSVMALFDGSGNVVNQYRYDPWGQAESASEGVANPFRFTGREFDAETGLQYHRARYYDPGLGRFISEDPIGLAGGINPYAYAANSALNAVDRFGLDPEECDGTVKKEGSGSDAEYTVTCESEEPEKPEFDEDDQTSTGSDLPALGPANPGDYGATNGGGMKSPDPDKVAGENDTLTPEDIGLPSCGEAMGATLVNGAMDFFGVRSLTAVARAGGHFILRGAIYFTAEFDATMAVSETMRGIGWSEGFQWRYMLPLVATGESLGTMHAVCRWNMWI